MVILSQAIEERTTGKLAGVLQTANMAEEARWRVGLRLGCAWCNDFAPVSTHQIAISTAGKMVENRETIGKIHSNVLAVDENLDTANKASVVWGRFPLSGRGLCVTFAVVSVSPQLITRFVKRLYTDKVCGGARVVCAHACTHEVPREGYYCFRLSYCRRHCRDHRVRHSVSIPNDVHRAGCCEASLDGISGVSAPAPARLGLLGATCTAGRGCW